MRICNCRKHIYSYGLEIERERERLAWWGHNCKKVMVEVVQLTGLDFGVTAVAWDERWRKYPKRKCCGTVREGWEEGVTKWLCEREGLEM